MVAAISGISSYSDPEYMRILQQLMALGITPTYNKSTDKAKLQQIKTELVQKIQQKESQNEKQSLQVQPLEPAQESQNSERSQMEESKLGAMNLAELNKLYFNL